MSNITPKQIIAGTATSIKAQVHWSDLDDINTWMVTYQYMDSLGVIKEVTQPIPSAALQAAGMTIAIVNSIRAWVGTQAGVTPQP